MRQTLIQRAVYRSRQFARAMLAHVRPLAAAERVAAHTWLPPAAWPLFDAMPRNDQRHSFMVLNSLRMVGREDRALAQAALLHDVAKCAGGITIFHRVAFVLFKLIRPDWPVRLAGNTAPARGSLRYPFWVHANHPRLGAEMAAAAGCDPLAVSLIRRHQEPQPPLLENKPLDVLLAALQAADDDN